MPEHSQPTTTTAAAATEAHRGPAEPSTASGTRNAPEALHGAVEGREEASTANSHGARDNIHRLFESGRTSYRLDEYLDAHRAEVLREAEGKAREIVARLWVDGTTRKQMDRADGARAVEWEIGLMASGNDEPAAAPTFFEPGRTYTSGTWKFRCEAISPSPGTGERRALGWKFAPVYGVHHWHAVALDPDDWQHGGWTEDAAAKAVQP